MKTAGAALGILIGLSGWVVGQLPVPSPPPVPPRSPDTLPEATQRLPPLRVRIATPSAAPIPEVITGAQTSIADIRVPTQFSALYSAPVSTLNTIPPAYLRPSDRASLATGCATCGTAVTCLPYGVVFGEVDYILWRTNGDGLPALITTSPAGTIASQAGVLGTPGAGVIYGRSGVGDDLRSGLRYNVGIWLDPARTVGLQTGGFFLEDSSTHAVFSSTGDPILARPFVNALTKAPASQLAAFPDVVAGSIGIGHTNSVDGFDVALRGNMCCAANWRLDALLGYRYLRIEDGLAISENLLAGPLGPGSLGVPAGTNLIVVDRFQTTNIFHGLQTGIAGEYRWANGWYVSGTGKASLGWIDQMVNVAGGTTVIVPGLAPVSSSGGLLALGSNIGRHAQSNAVIIPELNMNLGYQVTQNLRIRAGYNFLYISSVARPGNIIDTTINPGLIPPATGAATPARPAVQPDRADFILHGINAGLELRF